jgi:hypothetical protein
MKLFLRALILSSAVFAGCSAFDAKVDCDHICDRYRSCFDSDYDVAACSTRCQDAANSDADCDRKVDMCDVCIDGASCTQATFECAGDCVSVVP